jgi:hypothetical protein
VVWVTCTLILVRFTAGKSERLTDFETSFLSSFQFSAGHVAPLPLPTTVLFFNIYIPTGQSRTHALSITKSQMDDIRLSGLAKSDLFLNIIGDVTVDIPGCKDMRNCHIMNRMESGSESSTLQALYDYCVNHETHLVTYIHNKGSFTDTPENAALREMHMRSQLRTQACRDAVHAGTCNVCSARFSPLPHFHASGNMWTAHCSYVKDLISPAHFEKRMDDVMVALKADAVVMKEMFPCTNQHLVFDCIAPPHIGLERYSYEHWIHSHPNVVPCDVLPTSFKFIWNYNNIPDPKIEWTPEVYVGPRFPLIVYLNDYIPKSPKWWTLKGRIFEWHHLFKALPPRTSWVWYYYGMHSWENTSD